MNGLRTFAFSKIDINLKNSYQEKKKTGYVYSKNYSMQLLIWLLLFNNFSMRI